MAELVLFMKFIKDFWETLLGLTALVKQYQNVSEFRTTDLSQ